MNTFYTLKQTQNVTETLPANWQELPTATNLQRAFSHGMSHLDPPFPARTHVITL